MHAASPPLDESLPRLSAIRGARPLIRKSICSPADKLFRPEPNRSLPWRSVARNVNGIGAKADSIQNQNSTSTDYRLIVVGCCSKFFFSIRRYCSSIRERFFKNRVRALARMRIGQRSSLLFLFMFFIEINESIRKTKLWKLRRWIVIIKIFDNLERDGEEIFCTWDYARDVYLLSANCHSDESNCLLEDGSNSAVWFIRKAAVRREPRHFRSIHG